MSFKVPVRTWAKSLLPRRFHLGAPVAQLYVRDEFRTTKITLTNFPSLLSPERANNYYYEITAFGADGEMAGKERFEIGRFATLELDVGKLSFARRLNTYGLITAQIRPVNLIAYNDRHLGVITSHFYALYISKNWESIALVHPQTTLGSRPEPTMQWISGMRFEPAKFERLEVFQINPTDSPVRSALSLIDTRGKKLSVNEATLPPFGTRRIDWEPAELPEDQVRLAADGLTCANGKPLVFVHFGKGKFSASHA